MIDANKYPVNDELKDCNLDNNVKISVELVNSYKGRDKKGAWFLLSFEDTGAVEHISMESMKKLYNESNSVLADVTKQIGIEYSNDQKTAESKTFPLGNEPSGYNLDNDVKISVELVNSYKRSGKKGAWFLLAFKDTGGVEHISMESMDKLIKSAGAILEDVEKQINPRRNLKSNQIPSIQSPRILEDRAR